MKRPHSALSQAVRGSESDRGQSFTFDTALSEAPLALLAAARTTGRPYHRRPPLSQPRGKEIGVGLAFCCLPEWRVVALDAAGTTGRRAAMSIFTPPDSSGGLDTRHEVPYRT